MIVYGDPARCENTHFLIAELRAESLRLCEDAGGSQQSDRATSLLISSGELWQGLMDEQCERLGCDDWTPLSAQCANLTVAAAALAIDGYSKERATAFHLQLNLISEFPLPKEVTIKTPEGYAFYAVFPRLYAMAARPVVDQDSPTMTVIGLRSIGTSLAAVVAYVAGVHSPPISVRPQGHPFDRHLQLGDAMAARMLEQSNGRYAVVDEGPGLSGSSFLAVANWLIDHGVHEEQLDLFPSHGNEPGRQVSAANIARWRRVRRHYVDFVDVQPDVIDGLAKNLPVPHQTTGWKDISAGEWRSRVFASNLHWPPAHVQQERRKFLLVYNGTTYLAKFAGLGRYGRDALERGKRLSSEGLIPPVHSLRNGFLLQDWLDDARPLLEPQSLNANDRTALLEQVARYLEFEANQLPATRAGMSPQNLWKMARFNLSAHFGSEFEGALNEWERCLESMSNSARPVNTDNKMQPWEWLQLPEGSWLKADALDHHADHQCIGPQDIAWDVAGAVCELNLDDEEAGRLRERLSWHSLVCRSLEATILYEVCYLAFQLGYCTLAARSLAHLANEEKRVAQRRDYYAVRLHRLRPASPSHAHHW
jgi:hypothetical protein